MTPRGSSHLPLLLAAVLLLVPPGSRAALAQGGTGVIEGVVRDSGGAVLPGVTLSLQNQASGVTRTTVTDQAGVYRFPVLQPGTYTLRAEIQGFASNRLLKS